VESKAGVPFGPFLTPPIEGFIPFNPYGHQRVVRNPFGEVWMLPDVAIKLSNRLGILLLETFMENLLVESIPGSIPIVINVFVREIQ
jgi:hypothetical protein